MITDESHRVVAFTSVAMTAVDRSAAPSALGRRAPDPVPALLIGRLAVDRTWAGRGVGTALVSYVLATAVELNERAACRAVVVNALDDAARVWWEQLGFHRFDRDDPANLDLFLLTDEIAATLDALS